MPEKTFTETEILKAILTANEDFMARMGASMQQAGASFEETIENGRSLSILLATSEGLIFQKLGIKPPAGVHKSANLPNYGINAPDTPSC